MSALTGGRSYEDARAKGLPMTQALPFAASQAAIEYATEKLPLGQLLGDVKAGTPFMQMLAKQIALEVDGLTTATTRTWTAPDQDVNLTPNTGTFPAAAHAARHTNGSDDIQSATAAQKGLMSLAYAGKLDGIEAGADVTDTANVTAAFPISDATALVKDPVAPTKLGRIDVGAVTAGATRVITMGDRDVNLASGGTFAELVHASRHQNGGADEIAVAAAAANAIPKAGAGGTLAAGWLPAATALAA
jgi:hypothetical protein